LLLETTWNVAGIAAAGAANSSRTANTLIRLALIRLELRRDIEHLPAPGSST
jgi:hypothetical protein